MTGDGHLGGCILEGDIGTFAPQVWDRLIEDYQPKSVLDIGCGAGYSLQYFRQKGLYAKGVEGWGAAIVASPVGEHIFQHDFANGPFVPAHVFDLGWCCEFVEHVDEQFAENFLSVFEWCKRLAMTYAVPGQPGYHHVNCQPAEYWIRRLGEHGLNYKEAESKGLRQALFVNGAWAPNGGHCREKLLLFENGRHPHS